MSPVFAVLALVPLPALHCDHLQFVNAKHQPVRLRGVNLGGWFVEEMWMTPWVTEPPKGSSAPKILDHTSLWRQIEVRFGQKGLARIRDTWRTNWITSADFQRIKDLGFNHVRLPILASLVDEPGGMERLKSAIAQAANCGLYTVLDLHGAPGWQSNEHHTGEANRNRLWSDPENIRKAEQVWTKLALSFGKDPNVASFDLINEPMGAPNPAMLHLVHDRLIRAIRKVAPDKPLLVEDGYKGFETTPHPNVANWTNVAFSLHFYNFDAKKTEDHEVGIRRQLPHLIELQRYRQNPMYAGEFNVEPQGSPSAILGMVRAFDEANWSWAIWTYKTGALGGPMGQWGFYASPKPVKPLNPYTDSKEELVEGIKRFRTEKMIPFPGLPHF